MPTSRKLTRFQKTEQPINWFRAFLCGIFGVTLMMGFIDIFFMLGITPFSYEEYLGTALRGTMYGPHNWTAGLFANWLVGGLSGFLYAFVFESVLRRSSARLGVALGLGHAALAAVAFFPFMNIIQQQMGTGLYPDFGFFGSGLGGPTPILLLMGHLLFGATFGVFYGPVRAYRIRARFYESAEMGLPGDPEVVTEEEDPRDSNLVYPRGA